MVESLLINEMTNSSNKSDFEDVICLFLNLNELKWLWLELYDSVVILGLSVNQPDFHISAFSCCIFNFSRFIFIFAG